MAVALPSQYDLAWPTIVALRQLGGSGKLDEINDLVIALQALTEEQQAEPHGQGRTEVEYRLAWAKTWLKNCDMLLNSRRGVWALTERGMKATEREVSLLPRGSRAKRETAPVVDAGVADEVSVEKIEAEVDLSADWRTILLGVLRAMAPDAFERLCQRVLREAGFEQVEVTGKTNDGGIDGRGVYRTGLMSTPVFFQAKRYAGSVGAEKVRDFKGAVLDRGDRGLIITTGTFTAEARKEASRGRSVGVDLVDGDALCDLLRDLSLGVTPREAYDVQVDFFTHL